MICEISEVLYVPYIDGYVDGFVRHGLNFAQLTGKNYRYYTNIKLINNMIDLMVVYKSLKTEIKFEEILFYINFGNQCIGIFPDIKLKDMMEFWKDNSFLIEGYKIISYEEYIIKCIIE